MVKSPTSFKDKSLSHTADNNLKHFNVPNNNIGYVDNYEIRNSLQSDQPNPEVLETDENADFKRAILQTIFLDDIQSFM